jgi:hypothetical protein
MWSSRLTISVLALLTARSPLISLNLRARSSFRTFETPSLVESVLLQALQSPPHAKDTRKYLSELGSTAQDVSNRNMNLHQARRFKTE